MKLLAWIAVFAGTPPAHADFALEITASEAAAEFYMSHVRLFTVPGVQDSQPCIRYCEEVSGTYDKQTLLNFVHACKGNRGADCLSYVVLRTGVANAPQLIEAAKACAMAGDN